MYYLRNAKFYMTDEELNNLTDNGNVSLDTAVYKLVRRELIVNFQGEKTIDDFVREELSINPKGKEIGGMVYDAYQVWCAVNCVKPMGRNTLYRYVRAIAGVRQTTQCGKNLTFHGIELK